MMKPILGLLAVMLLAAPVFPHIRVFVLPGADVFGNQAGPAFLVGAEADLASLSGVSFLQDTWIGLGGGAATVSNGSFALNQMNLGLCVDWECRNLLGLPVFGGVSLLAAPSLAQRFTRSGNSGNLLGMLLMPRLVAGMDLGDSLQIALTAGPKFEIFGTFSLNSLSAGIELAWLIKSSSRIEPAAMDKIFSTELENILQSNQIKALVSKQKNETRLEMSDVLFEKGLSEVDTNFARVIADIGNTLKNYSNLYVLVEGHSDNVGEEKFNRELSEKRALAVAEIFLASGMPFSKVFSKGYGSSQPIESNDAEKGRSRNRRVEIRFIENKK